MIFNMIGGMLYVDGEMALTYMRAMWHASFFSDEGEQGHDEDSYRISRWTRVVNKDVCPTCAAEYQAYITKYFNKSSKEETNNVI